MGVASVRRRPVVAPDGLQVFPPPRHRATLAQPDAPTALSIGALGLDPSVDALIERVEAMTTPQLRALVAAGETGVVDLRALAKRLHAAKPGKKLREHARGKVAKPLSALGDDDVAKALKRSVDVYDPDKLPVVLGPNGRVVLLDGHHKSAALLMLFGLADRLYADALPIPNKRSGPLAALHGALRDVDVRVVDNLTHLDEDTFWRTLEADRTVYLERRDRTRAERPRAHFSQLDDNPYRALAGETVAKVISDGKRVELEGADRPLWIKGPDAANFIEFEIGAVLEDVFTAAGETYAVGDTITKARRVAMAEALAAVQGDPDHPRHDALAPLLLADGKTSIDKLAKRVRL